MGPQAAMTTSRAGTLFGAVGSAPEVTLDDRLVHATRGPSCAGRPQAVRATTGRPDAHVGVKGVFLGAGPVLPRSAGPTHTVASPLAQGQGVSAEVAHVVRTIFDQPNSAED